MDKMLAYPDIRGTFCFFDALPPGLLDEVLAYLDIASGLVELGIGNRSSHERTSEFADTQARLFFAGVHPLQHVAAAAADGRLPHWLSLQRALRPKTLVRKRSRSQRFLPDRTELLPMVLDTAGSWFVEYEIIAAKAFNGPPRIGLVDAGIAFSDLDGTQIAWDLSQKGAGGLAISCSPHCGKLFASCSDSLRNRGEGIKGPSCHAAHLNWGAAGDVCDAWNYPIQAGFLVEKGTLAFFRACQQGGVWHSSGVLCRDLPEKVIPAMFLSSFVGFASVRFVKLWDSPPEVCPHCDSVSHGVYDGWHPWPKVD